MPTPLPPYALPQPQFRFAHLATFAGRAPIGGAREVALSCLVIARLAHDALLETTEEPDARAERWTGARAWLGTQTLPAQVRASLIRCVDAASMRNATNVSQELVALSKTVAEYLDAPTRGELEGLAAALRR